MGYVTSGLQSLIGGVSKQHPSKRLSNQCEESINCDATPHDGLKKRSPTEFVADVGNGRRSVSDLRMHSVSRDRSERYLVTVAPQSVYGPISVFDEDGGEYDVYAPGGGIPNYDYLDQRTPQLVTRPLMEDFANANWHEGVATSPVATRTEISGPFGFGEFYRLSVVPIVGTTDEGFYYTDSISTLDAVTKKSVSIYVRRASDVDGDSGIELALVEDVGGTPTRHDASFSWNTTTGALETRSEAVDVDSDVEYVGDDVYRARMIYTPGILATQCTRLEIKLPYSGAVDGSEYGIFVYGLQLTESDTLQFTAPYFPDYMAGTAAQNVRLLTVADYTFISNAAITVEKDATLSSEQNSKLRDGAIVFFRQFSFNTTFSGKIVTDEMVLNPPAAGSWSNWSTTSGNGSVHSDSQLMAQRFYTHVTSLPESAYLGATKYVDSSVVWVWPQTDSPVFEDIWFDDGQGGDHIVLIRDTVEDFTLLPTIAPPEYKVKIDGDPTIEEDNYWVESERVDDGTDATKLAEVRWVETIAPEIEYKFDEDTMPHQLVRMQDDDSGTITGTPGKIYFEYGPVSWTDRLVGDDITNEWPPFVDGVINGLAFAQNRLGFLSGSTITLSEANEFFNLFRTTVRQVPDSDRISIEPASQKVANIYTAATMDERFILIGDQAQFVVRGEPTLSPRTVSATETTQYDALPNTPVVPSGETLFFASPNHGDTRIMEMAPLTDRSSFTARDASDAALRYIEGEATDIASSPTARCLCVITPTDPSLVYVYRWAVSGDEKIQEAWMKWDFGGNVIAIEWIEQKLFLLTRRLLSTGVYETTLEKLELGSLLEDETLPFQVHLDRRETLTGSYASATDLTTFTLSYTPTSPALVTQPDSSGAGMYRLQIDSQTGANLTVRGDWSDETVWAGELYTSRYVFSRPYLRERSVPAGVQSQLSLPTSICSLVLELRDTYQLDVAVEGPINTDSFKAIRGPEINEAVLGTFTAADGMHRCGIMADPRREAVALENDSPWPFRVVGAEWEAMIKSRGRRAPV